jgi:hypothetical protein
MTDMAGASLRGMENGTRRKINYKQETTHFRESEEDILQVTSKTYNFI